MKNTGNKSKYKQVRLHQAKKRLHGKRNNQQNEKAIYGMEEKVANHLSDKGLNPKQSDCVNTTQ